MFASGVGREGGSEYVPALVWNPDGRRSAPLGRFERQFRALSYLVITCYRDRTTLLKLYVSPLTLALMKMEQRRLIAGQLFNCLPTSAVDKVQYDRQEEEYAPNDDIQHTHERRSTAEPRCAADDEVLPDVELRKGLVLVDTELKEHRKFKSG